MVCIYCHKDTSVINSRYKSRSLSVWRRRACTHCGAVLTTYETYDLSTALLVKKRSGELQAFQRDKLLISIAKAIEHKHDAANAASHLTTTVVHKLINSIAATSLLSTKDISHMTSTVLKRYDAASAIKYLSFQSPTATSRDVKSMLKDHSREQK